MGDRMSVRIDGDAAEVRLHRSAKLHALDPATGAAPLDTGETIDGHRSVRPVVLAGAGRAFCAGHDHTGRLSLVDDFAEPVR